MLAGQCFGCAVPRACGFPDVVLPSAACPARNARSRTPLPLVFGVSPVIVKLPGGSQRLRLSDPSLNKTTPGVIARRSVYARLANLFVARPLSINALLYSTSAAATIRFRGTHVNKNTLSDSQGCCFTRPWPVALEQRSS